MPCKKKSSRSKKPPLLFLESPLKGEKRKKVLSLPSAVNPRQVSCIPVDQKSAVTWVLPEFETTAVQGPRQEQKSGGRAKQRCISNKRSTASKTGAVRKLHMNFVPLTFMGTVQKENHQVPVSTCQKVQTHGQGRFQTNKTSFVGSKFRQCRIDTNENVQKSNILDMQKSSQTYAVKNNLDGKSTVWNKSVRCSSLCPPLKGINHQTDSDETEIFSERSSQSADEVFTLPQVNTPTTDGEPSAAILKKNICGRLRNNELNKQNATPLPGGLLGCSDKCLALKDNCSEESFSADVLVQDTPEREYGLKATWRRRPHIMQFLKDHGKLTSSDVRVGS
ncbi:RAD9, HUS1, RAD1-interacting nuclear orphan protein 1 [Narcine bancroftii]|uniref:RAD9, HUS1, RAD1-interacting nuclear orphan protein 1 n=1 Tax=Narcine bancroftii TaxID=1343680 RepID=UPI003831B736